MKKWGYLAIGLLGVLLISFVGFLLIVFLGNYVIDEDKLVVHSSSEMVDLEGNFVSKLYNENHQIVSISDIPDYTKQAVVSIEDERFYKHHGIDTQSIFRAIVNDIKAFSKVQGASTLTQQLAKNVFLTNDKTFMRKTKEVIIAINLERKYTKDQILEMYLNQVYFGHGVYGIGGAAKYYFGKDVKNLTIEESASLAALLKAPSHYDPVTQPERSLERRNLVLYKMLDTHYITESEYQKAKSKPSVLHITEQKFENGYATYIDMVIKEAKEKYGISYDQLLNGGYKVVVPIHKKTQLTAYKYFKNGNYFPGTDQNAEGAFVLINSETGGVEAAIGGRNYYFQGLNRINVKRQPGSTMKPLLVYSPALETGNYNPYSLLPNEQSALGDYKPKNYNGVYTKTISMFNALIESANVPAVWLLNDIGIDNAKEYLEKMDLNIPDEGLSMALGGLKIGLTPLELVKAYSAFDHDGDALEPFVINAIYDRNNELVAEAKIKEYKVFSSQTSWYMTKMLKGVVNEGTASRGSFTGDLAGKTGSTNIPGQTNGNKDAWFVGYTPDVVGAIWMGYDKTDSKHFLRNGSTYPTILFKKILSEAGREPSTKFKKPKNIDDLESPINLEPISNVQSKVSFSPFGLFTVVINWNAPTDHRQQYRIYRVKNGKEKLIDTVTGLDEYKDSFVNVFNVPSYYVVPYNPQTKEEGDRSKLVKPNIRNKE
ncbi:transglycosylase domain-containing protein [Gottfriedia acidiceleris]|uniref:PBP1A family penicillin-binding protein n=1 Tax=Gottfriedia acidiceleris TaxID=371036 RepID=A0ABY4JKT1_9BACI|nr:PBP1A family penicillin-binding protein [Gottfriedia acidiceleris]UPM53493.1 PBP1A family penicillin-binding protein [Gottfriedia acidiceleris]